MKLIVCLYVSDWYLLGVKICLSHTQGFNWNFLTSIPPFLYGYPPPGRWRAVSKVLVDLFAHYLIIRPSQWVHRLSTYASQELHSPVNHQLVNFYHYYELGWFSEKLVKNSPISTPQDQHCLVLVALPSPTSNCSSVQNVALCKIFKGVQALTTKAIFQLIKILIFSPQINSHTCLWHVAVIPALPFFWGVFF